MICDGQNSTPDLRNRFVVGHGSNFAVDATGGSADAIVVSHSHSDGTYTTSGVGDHNHSYVDQVNDPNGGYRWWKGGDNDCRASSLNTGGGGAHSHDVTGTSGTTGSSGTNANLPPYYALCYIMKT